MLESAVTINRWEQSVFGDSLSGVITENDYFWRHGLTVSEYTNSGYNQQKHLNPGRVLVQDTNLSPSYLPYVDRQTTEPWKFFHTISILAEY